MALKATVFKINLDISNIETHYYQTHSLTIARHPSETNERLVIRLVAFALNANEQLSFTKGLSTPDTPDLWQLSLSEEIEHWIDVGRPSEEHLRKAASKSEFVSVYCYGENQADIWWEAIENKLSRFSNMRIFRIDEKPLLPLTEHLSRSMDIQCTIDDTSLWLNFNNDNGDNISIEVTPKKLS